MSNPGAAPSMTCARPGCDGTLDQDGFCDGCGFRGEAATARLRSEPRAVPTSTWLSTDGGMSGASRPSTQVVRSTSTRGNLGAGLVDVPPVPSSDPLQAVLTDPHVPAHKRSCSACGNAVGDGRDGRPALGDGYCTRCGRHYSFTPKLKPGDLVAGQYQVAGCLAHGGMGWLYLARDRNLDDRWVVLKGLLDAGNEQAMSAVIAERRFLAQVSHPNIVEIFNFVEHDGAGYIVMAYVPGFSLREIRQRYREQHACPLPLDVAIAYCLEVLSAIGFLHSRGLIYCDLKPDNVIQNGELLTLIDLGGVRRIDDEGGDVFGTVGYQAPEIGERGPSVSSDLYTVARTLAVLSIDMAGYHDEKRYATRLPPADEVPVFREHQAFHDLLLRATDVEPARRFASAAEMADQMFGVLRQVVAFRGGEVTSARSRFFGGERPADTTVATWRCLPLPLVDQDDAGAALLANLTTATPLQVLVALEAAEPTLEIELRRVRAAIEIDDLVSARRILHGLTAGPDVSEGGGTVEAASLDWRVRWWLGILALAGGQPHLAQPQLRGVAAFLPGELAPRLALGVCAESRAEAELAVRPGSAVGQARLEEAAGHYRLVSATEPSLSSAAFGANRALERLGDRDGAVAALERVPPTSVASLAAHIRLCSTLYGTVGGQAPSQDDLVKAMVVLGAVEASGAAPTTCLSLRRALLLAALGQLSEGVPGVRPDFLPDGTPWTEPTLRSSIESTVRRLALHASTADERNRLVDEANKYRPWTRT